jgi:hypothetical protein
MKSDARGFLTEQDRDYLKDNLDITEGAEYNTRRRIRERARQGFLDYQLLFDELSEDDRRDIFEEELDVTTNRSFQKALADTLAFIFLGARGRPYLAGTRHVDDPWMKVLTGAVRRAGIKSGYHVSDVDFDVDAKAVHVDRAKEKLKRGEMEKLTAAEIEVLVKEGEAEVSLKE